MNWATTRDLYAYWPSLASLDTVSDERLRDFLETAEATVARELAALGFRPEEADPAQLKRLVVFRALADVLSYPHGERGTPANLGRAAEWFYARYLDELRRIVQRPQTLGGIDPRSAAVPRAFSFKSGV